MVGLQKIVENCEISERTAYRYVKNLIDAGIPIFYDYHRGGYRLANSENILCGVFPAPESRNEFGRL